MDPRVLAAWERGDTIAPDRVPDDPDDPDELAADDKRGAVEKAVIGLLDE